MNNSARVAASLVLLAFAPMSFACTEPVSVCAKASPTSFPLILGGRPVALLVEASANSAVKIAAGNFALDLERVSGKVPFTLAEPGAARGELLVVGVAGQSAAIDGLVRAGKLDVSDLS